MPLEIAQVLPQHRIVRAVVVTIERLPLQIVVHALQVVGAVSQALMFLALGLHHLSSVARRLGLKRDSVTSRNLKRESSAFVPDRMSFGGQPSPGDVGD